MLQWSSVDFFFSKVFPKITHWFFHQKYQTRFLFGCLKTDLKGQNINMKNLPFTNGFHSRNQKSKIPKKRRVFHTLWLLTACVLSLPLGNIEPAHGFSISKSLLSIHEYSAKDETIVAPWLVKDFIIERGGIEELKSPKNCWGCVKGHQKHIEQILNSRGK